MERHRFRVSQSANQQLVLQQVLQQSLGPTKELMPRVHSQRRIHVQNERFELEWIQLGRVAGSDTVHCDRGPRYKRQGTRPTLSGEFSRVGLHGRLSL